jgi:hypothetical protein
MSKLQIKDGLVLDYTDEGWAEYKKWLDGTYARIPFIYSDNGLSYEIVAPDGGVYRTFSVNKVDATDFEANFKSFANRSLDYNPVKLLTAALKDGSSSNMAVNGSGTARVYTYNPPANFDIEVHTVTLVAESAGAIAFGNKFIDTNIGTLTNGLLIEVKINDVTSTWHTAKRTRDLVELSANGGFNVMSGTPNLLRVEFHVCPRLRMAKDGTFATPDYIKATVRDNLTTLSYMEIFVQGAKL